jgi:hypothetical protein
MLQTVHILQLYVGKDDTIGDIQKKFSELFPHLCISLFRHTGGIDSLSEQDILFSPETKMTDINPVLREGRLEINPHMNVSTFESVFFNQFGLFAQISRKNRRFEAEKIGIDQFALDEANREEKSGTPIGAETILFRDVPYGC